MPRTARTFRIFVSSTFSDLKSERNALQARVFPQLRDLAAKHGYRFQVIDLRWGVSEEASLDQQAMNICLDEVARCQKTSPRPNFIVLLGDRYGWLPPASTIPDGDFKRLASAIDDPQDQELLKKWYMKDENAIPPEWRLKPREKGSEFEKYSNWQPVEARLQKILADAANQITFTEQDRLPFIASATEQEIAAGALQITDAPEHVTCFFRSIENLPDKFNNVDFNNVLVKRLQTEYSGELSSASKNHITTILEISNKFSGEKIASTLQHLSEATSKNTSEKEVLDLMHQVLVDFTARDFVNLNEKDWTIEQATLNKQNLLKQRLFIKMPENVFNYRTRWTGEGITSDHIDQLCGDVYSALERIILDEIKKPHLAYRSETHDQQIQTDQYLDSEGLAHQRFAEERIQFFIGRTSLLKKIEEYTQNENHQILSIVGAGGTGKSALMAKAVQEAQVRQPNAQIVYRFIGATPGSSDGRTLLYGLCLELTRRFGGDEKGIPMDYRDLVSELGKLMKLATAAKPLILFLDSLDQLSNTHGARSLNWLPVEIPEHVSIIATTREEDTYENIKARNPIQELLGGLSRDEGDELLSLWLSNAGRELLPTQKKEVLDKFECKDMELVQGISPGNALYLKLAFEEARMWTSYAPSEELTTGIAGIIKDNMFDRLMVESNHGEMLVSHALGYLSASRYGLAEEELVDLLSRDFQVYEWFFKNSYHVPADLLQLAVDYRRETEGKENLRNQEPSNEEERAASAWLKDTRTPPEQVSGFLKKVLSNPNGPRIPIVLWSRLSFDLAPYLSDRLLENVPLLNFYHRELGDVSNQEFLSGGKEQYYHEKLAEYFQTKADPKVDKSWTGNHIHGLSELPYHLTKAGKRDAVFEVMTDFKFLEHKAEEVGITKTNNDNGLVQISSDGVQQLQNDYKLVLDTFYGGDSDWNSNKAPLIRTAEKDGNDLKVFCPVCNRKSKVDKDQLGKVISCPQESCNASLKLNDFVIEPV